MIDGIVVSADGALKDCVVDTAAAAVLAHAC